MLRSSIARLAVTLLLLVGAVSAASAPGAAVFGPTDAITIAGLRRHLNFVASDGTAAGEPVYVGQGWRIPSRKVDPYAGLDVNGRMLVVLHGPANLDLARSDYTTAQENARSLGARGVVTVASFQGLAAWTRAKDLA